MDKLKLRRLRNNRCALRSYDMHAPRKISLTERFQRSPYLFGAILIHLILGLIFGSRIILPQLTSQEEVTIIAVLPQSADPAALLPPPPKGPDLPDNTTLPDAPAVDSSQNLASLPPLIQNDSPSPLQSFSPTPRLGTSSAPTPTTPVAKPRNPNGIDSLNERRKDFYKVWFPEGKASGPAQFVCYVASVQGLDSKRIMEDSNGLERGPLFNLMRMTQAWSQGKLKARLEPKAISVASPELLEKNPPMIYLFGSRDFKFTDAEIENLRKYLQVGGAIWGDSGIAGVSSRFDVAFRREMKRVFGEVEFEVLPPEHPIFGGPKALFQLNGTPPGMNYRQDPVEVMRLDGEIAVIYTPNNYTDLMRVAFQEPLRPRGNTIELANRSAQSKANPFVTPTLYWHQREIFFRNFSVEGAEDSYRLGINILLHLITRWPERLMFE